MHSGKLNSTQAWKITSSFVRRIFTEIEYARASARDAINIGASLSSGSSVLFDTLHAHSVMRKFMSFSIKYHPSISSEIVMCYSVTSTNTSEFITRISEVGSFQISDQSNLDNQ